MHQVLNLIEINLLYMSSPQSWLKGIRTKSERLNINKSEKLKICPCIAF